MKTFSFWQRWLFIFSLIVVIFGLVMAVFNRTPIFAFFDLQLNPVFWGTNPLPPGVNEFQGFVYGVLGATMAGWGVIMAFIIRCPFQARERWAWNALALGLSIWFVTDTSISLYSGVIFNAIFNTVFFIFVALPLVFTRKEFQKS